MSWQGANRAVKVVVELNWLANGLTSSAVQSSLADQVEEESRPSNLGFRSATQSGQDGSRRSARGLDRSGS